jgi:hypothetical protein
MPREVVLPPPDRPSRGATTSSRQARGPDGPLTPRDQRGGRRSCLRLIALEQQTKRR